MFPENPQIEDERNLRAAEQKRMGGLSLFWWYHQGNLSWTFWGLGDCVVSQCIPLYVVM